MSLCLRGRSAAAGAQGLYTEGIYRKSGSACRARELHQLLETGKKKFLKIEMYKILSEEPNKSSQLQSTWSVRLSHNIMFLVLLSGIIGVEQGHT